MDVSVCIVEALVRNIGAWCHGGVVCAGQADLGMIENKKFTSSRCIIVHVRGELTQQLRICEKTRYRIIQHRARILGASTSSIHLCMGIHLRTFCIPSGKGKQLPTMISLCSMRQYCDYDHCSWPGLSCGTSSILNTLDLLGRFFSLAKWQLSSLAVLATE